MMVERCEKHGCKKTSKGAWRGEALMVCEKCVEEQAAMERARRGDKRATIDYYLQRSIERSLLETSKGESDG